MTSPTSRTDNAGDRRPSTAVAALRSARRLIARPEHWTKNEYARDERGRGVDHHSPRAISFCLRGAIYRVCGGHTEVAEEAIEILKPHAQGHVTIFNDGHQHDSILRALDAAISGAPRP